MAVFLVSTVAWLADLIVGGTRQYHHRIRYLPVYWHYSRLDYVVDAGGGGRAGDCWHVLAGVKRYGMNVSGDEAFYTFLYLTRDTFSPWRIWRCTS